MIRPQTACSSQESPQKNYLINLQLSQNKRLLEQFPKDNHADLIIQVKNKRFELQKAHLRIESNFFDTENQLISINEYDPDIFEGLLRCIYGGTYPINTFSELYQAYQISSFIKCEGLCKQIENSFIVTKKSFTLAFQLSELYGLEELKHQCYEYLDTQNDAFLQILDIGILKIKKTHKKTTPSDALGLNNQCFIQLIQAHNTYKFTKPGQRKFLSNLDLFKLLELYSIDDDHLKELVLQLIDRDTLNSDEYEQIYHKLALKLQNIILDEPSIQKFHKSIKDYKIDQQQQQQQQQINQDIFNINISENYLIKKRMFELEEQNIQLKQEISKLSIALETSMKSTTNLKDSLLQTLQEQIDIKLFEKEKEIEYLKKEVETLKSELFQKEQTIFRLNESEKDLNDRDSESFIVQSTNSSQFFQQQELAQSEVQLIKPFTQTLQLSVSSINKYDCDSEPLTLDNNNQLNYIFDFLGITIYSQIYLRRQYLGSRDGYDVLTFEQKCYGLDNLLLLIRVFDYNNIIGILYFNNKKYLLSITNQNIIEKDEINLFNNNKLIEIPNELIINNECGNNINYGSIKLTGDKEFQVDEIEAYQVQISHQL